MLLLMVCIIYRHLIAICLSRTIKRGSTQSCKKPTFRLFWRKLGFLTRCVGRRSSAQWQPAGFFLTPEQQPELKEFVSCLEIATASNEALNHFVNKCLFLQYFNMNKFHSRGGHQSKLSGLFQNKKWTLKKHFFKLIKKHSQYFIIVILLF